MELNHLKTFYEVARLGSFTAAARFLRVSQPSLSRTVRLLEEGEGVRLLERGKNGVSLTADGRAFFDGCARIFAEVDQLHLAATRGSREISGDLSLAASDNLCNHVLPRILPDFGRRHPKVRVRLFAGTSDQILQELRAQQAELGLFYTETRNAKAFASEPLWEVEFVPVCAPEHGASDLGALGFIGSRASDYAKAYPALSMLRSVGVEPKTIFETNNQETQKQLALAGLGYTLVPRHMVESELRTGRLRRLKTPRSLKGRVFLVRKKSRALSRAAQALRETLQAFDYKSLF
jgi:DNA-binding transcriptional LysR family regulator